MAYIKNTRTPFRIDLAVGDIIIPHPQKRPIPTQLPDFEPPLVNTYSVETSIAEKLDAILDLMDFSSRMKDYYDIYYLARKFDFDGAVLVEALDKTFANRHHLFTADQFKRMTVFDADAGMQRKWNTFIGKIDTKTDRFGTVLKTIDAFLAEPFLAAVKKNTALNKQWSATVGKWQ